MNSDKFKLKLTISETWVHSYIPLVGLNDEWIAARRNELLTAYSELTLFIASIDVNNADFISKLLSAANVGYQLMQYKCQLTASENRMNGVKVVEDNGFNSRFD